MGVRSDSQCHQVVAGQQTGGEKSKKTTGKMMKAGWYSELPTLSFNLQGRGFKASYRRFCSYTHTE